VTLVRKGQAIEGLEQTLVACAAATFLSLLLMLAPAARAAVPTAIEPGVLGLAALAALAWLLPCTWLLLWGARHLEPGRVALLLLLEVAVAAGSAAWLAGEPFGGREAAGCLMILAAGAVEALSELRASRLDPAHSA
jgi:drug/metabolite transporter (DMT)-like permease